MKHNNTVQKNKEGFTIIETLVAIAILMIAIAGPLTIAQKSLAAALSARDQITASFLAQDAIEYIKNRRDSSTSDFTSWLDAFVTRCNVNSRCNVDSFYLQTVSQSERADFDTLYILKDGGYGTNSNGGAQPKSDYKRNLYATRLSTDEAVITVEVKWNSGTVSNSVIVQDDLFKVKL